MSRRLDEISVIELVENGCEILIGRLSITPIKRHQNAKLEYMVDCDHYKAKISKLFKSAREAAEKFCMLKNVIYGGRRNDLD